MAIRTIDDSKLQDIAVAIQGKDSGGTMTVDEMPTRIATIPTQDNTTLNSLINRSITSIENSEVASIGASAFEYCSDLTSVSFPNATLIDDNAFYGCSNLTSVSFPNATIINNNAFYICSNLTSVSFPNATSIGNHAFRGDSNLTSVSFPNVTSIGSNAFRDDSNLTILILGKRARLPYSNAFSGTNNAIIYVKPGDLEWYSTATNWSTLYAQNRIKSIEDLTGDDLVWYQEQLARYRAA